MARVNLPSKFAEDHGKKNYTKAELKEKAESEVIVDDSKIEPSSFLPEKLHDKFYWFVEEFGDVGILGNVDSDALSRYVMADHNYWKTNKALEKMAVTNEAYGGLTLIQNRYFNQSMALAKELGLTMVSRSKLKRDDKEDAEKELTDEEKLFGSSLGLN